LRRTYEYKSRDFDVFKYRDAVFDFKKLIITRGDDEVELTKNESFILSVLSQKMNEVVLRNEIIEALWDDSRFISDNTLTVNVNRLRKKLEVIGLHNAVETKTGSGYILKRWKMYFKENISVIILFLIMISFIVLVGLVDSGIPNVSIIYL